MKCLTGKMNHGLFFFILFFIGFAFFSLPPKSAATERFLVLDPAVTSYPLGPYAGVLKDPGVLTIDQVTAPGSDLKFEFPGTPGLNCGTPSGAVWIRFTLKSLQGPLGDFSQEPWVLNPGSLFPAVFTLYVPSQKPGEIKTWETQKSRAPIVPAFTSAGSGEKPFFFLPGSLDPATPFYLKIESQTPVILSPKIINDKKNQVEYIENIIFFNLVYGAILALAVYHFCLFLSLKDMSSLYFVFYLLCSCAYQYSMQNPTIFGLIAIEDIRGYNRISLIFGTASLLCYTLFVRSFLRTRHSFPLLDRGMLLFIFINFLLGIMSLTGVNPRALIPFTDFLLLFSSFFYCGIGYLAWKKQIRQAKFFLISTIFPCISVIYIFLVLGNILPNSSRIFSFVDISFALEGMLLSLALADRITILRSERQFAQGASLAKSQFLASMSHEIRTPMNAILGMADLLRETPLNNEQNKYVTIFQNAGQNLLDLINDILDISKIEAGQIDLRKTDFNIGEVIDNACEVLALNAHEKNLELLCRMDPEVPKFVTGDSIRLRQVIINLLGNAIKFTPKGEILLETKVHSRFEDGVELIFCVTDTGIGIPLDQQEHVFENFTQIDHSNTRSYGGTGLGLAISRQIVQLMGGEIWLTSEEGKGSCFTFTAHFKTATQPPVKSSAHLNVLIGIHVLVIDDNATNRLILREQLLSWGAIIKEATGGKQGCEAVKMARKEGTPFQLILLDSRMPGMSGIETARQMAQENSTLTHTVIMLTSDESRQEISTAQQMGIKAYLIKPVKQKELKETIQFALSGKIQINLPQDSPPPPSVNGEILPMKILLVEDAQENRFVIQAYLRTLPHEIKMAENGQIGLDLYKAQPFDMVLMDMHMPVMDGYTATQKLREWEKKQGKKPTPVIALTAHALKDDRQKCLDAGCDEYLSKPIKKARLIEMLESFAPPGNPKPASPKKN
jgi:signal transduction histidine kinase/CheY-like chemotaxis protein